ncbi:DUF4147 domain-containing protein [Pendulispora albinea]|uniref:Glycerate kinase n=1 Tax=Pendulispora albinea TaxID=2741071 RepID=A0ABZ2LV07_9BACT
MSLRAALQSAFREALRALDFAGAVRRELADPQHAPAEGGRVFAAAVGKAAPQMMQGARDAWGARIARALVVCPDQTPCALEEGPELAVIRAGHPLPDARSVDAGARLLELARQTTARDTLLVLVSGGASALACAPNEDIGFATKLSLTHALLGAGATIVEFNTVRRHVSRLKGGGLTRAARGSVLALLASDVIGGAPHDIGSGPAAPDPTTVDDARALLHRYAPAFASLPLAESLKAADSDAARARHVIVVEPELLVEYGVRALEPWHLSAVRLAPSMASVTDLAAEYAQLAQSLAPGQAYVRVAEPSLRIDAPNPGRGGRSGHLAALVGADLPPGVAFLAGASDGADGTSNAAGAAVDTSFLSVVSKAHHAEHVARFDTAALHEAAGTAIVTGPTGVNLCDLHILAREL